ncbi:hypothetical protein [Microbacterium lacus]|uniref:hypothetical protein n=1 Tax=Microbacterium lacus TaxID=415217 RepID=UPI000C2BBB4B|nr:hypothetical protein [Microbacterium lacus]
MSGRRQDEAVKQAIRSDPSLLDPTQFVRLKTGRVECVLCRRSGTERSFVGLPDFRERYWWQSWAPWQYGCMIAHTYRCTCGRAFPAYNNLWRHIGGERPAGWGRQDGLEHRALDLPETETP